MMIINLLLLGLGCIMDMAPLILICAPIMLPVAMGLGIHPVHFGIIMIMNLSIGLLTPPVGVTLFVGSTVGEVPLEKLARTNMPFYLLIIVVLLLITYIPPLVMWLPLTFMQ
jgi:TRAP-type C4-dicarboxylate transport system permease large subunit